MAARFLAFAALFLARGHALPASPYADFLLPTPTIATPLNTTAGFDILLKPTTLRRSYVALAPQGLLRATIVRRSRAAAGDHRLGDVHSDFNVLQL